uniref:Group 2 allergen Aca s 2 n=1 Tax=Acarus siro TaxID=66546 RepID=A7XZH1_ACASI|nr:group 2 allergen Aca s 2 [Acarus siro]
MLQNVCLPLFVAVASATPIPYTDCGNHELSKLDANLHCAGDLCTIHKGKELKLDAQFTVNQDTAHVKIQLTASMGGIEIPVPGVGTDGCKYIKCPLVKGEKKTFPYTYLVPKILPSVTGDVKAVFTGDHGPLGCLKFHGKIVD